MLSLNEQEIFSNFLRQVSKYAATDEIEELKNTFEFAGKKFKEKLWAGNIPQLHHNLQMATSLAEMQQDISTLLAALLHDCVDFSTFRQDNDFPLFIKAEAIHLVRGVEKLGELAGRTQSLQQVDNLRKMLISEAGDLRALILHLADHQQAMENLELFHETEKSRLLSLCQKLYAPLAGRLGIHRLKSFLEDIGLKYTHHDEYENIVTALAKTKIERENYIKHVTGMIYALLLEKNIHAHVYGRIKHIASIYNKMQRQGVDISGIYDIIGFRIIVDSEQKCWEALGLIHGKWQPIPGRFRDYVSQPKKNGYRSLHTSVIGPHREKIEIQIRTWQMHKFAEEGIAAHWRYKEGNKKVSPLEETQLKWLTESLKEDGQDAIQPQQMFSTEIYVFTPAGDVIALPNGATPLDFAYTIHTSVGHRTSAAIVNGSMVPLSYQLKSGDIVRIITRSGQHPRKDWLELVKTSRARTKIRAYFNAELKKEMIEKGRKILEKYLRDRSFSLTRMEKKGKIKGILPQIGVSSTDELFIKIASGKLQCDEIYEALHPGQHREKEIVSEEKILADLKRDSADIALGDIRHLLVRFAGCCHPLPGDKIMGFITRGRGITIHRASCPFLLSVDSERLVAMTWNISEGAKTLAGLKILAEDSHGILAKLTQFIASRGFNITSARSERTDEGLSRNLFTFEISSVSKLGDLIRSIEKIPGVKSVQRI